jgi:hypothetical protein
MALMQRAEVLLAGQEQPVASEQVLQCLRLRIHCRSPVVGGALGHGRPRCSFGLLGGGHASGFACCLNPKGELPVQRTRLIVDKRSFIISPQAIIP